MSDYPDNLRLEHLLWREDIVHVAGVDEAGRGPLAGPVVAAAVIFEPYVYIRGVNDSKKLSAKKREQLFDLITEHAMAYGIGIVDHTEIDDINIRNATFKAMRKAIGALRMQPGYLLVDGEEMPDKLYPQEALVSGDSLSFTIAAASILAKVTRDREMLKHAETWPQYGFAQHKGYGTQFHREMIQKHGPCPIHRKLFLRKILNTDEDS